MQIVGFSLTKIMGEKTPDFKEKVNIATNIEFPKVEKEKIELLREGEAYRIDFKFAVSYEKAEEKKKEPEKVGEIVFHGSIILSVDENDPKDILKSLKKKEIPTNLKEGFLNLLLKKCTAKALDLEDQLGLPFHLPFPRVKLQEKQE